MNKIIFLMLIITSIALPQKKMTIRKTDGTLFHMHTNVIQDITFSDILKDTIAWYKFNNNIFDTSGYENHCKSTGIEHWSMDRFGNENGSLACGPTFKTKIPNKPMFNFIGSFTISVWISPNEGIILDKGCYKCNIIGGKAQFILTDKNGFVQTINGTIILPVTTKFHNLTFIRDIDTDKISIYVNDQLDVSVEDLSTSTFENTNDISFGFHYQNIDELVICSYACIP